MCTVWKQKVCTPIIIIIIRLIAVTRALPSAAFGAGTGPIWISDLTCIGTETSLFECSSSTPLGSISSISCTHSNDVAVRCQGLPSGDQFRQVCLYLYH